MTSFEIIAQRVIESDKLKNKEIIKWQRVNTGWRFVIYLTAINPI
jgi:hypothetical protein